ncbi:MAG TPA: zinc ribbon domain-containing protein [Thermomicrobiales bacterium]|nr:zinc ribbon domain-containing protein [Thermomicrobiales bacterium]
MIETAARGVQFFLAIGIAYLIALWFALVAWTFRDIESRSRSVFTQVFSTLLVVLFFVPGLLLYLILRPKETLDQAFQRALEEEYLLQDLDDLPLCPGCQRTVDTEFVLCPHCQTALRGPCPACSRLIDLRWNVCPYCSVPVDRSELGIAASSAETVKILEDARSGRRKRAVAAAAQRVGIQPEELDAFTEALSATPSRPAVGAGAVGSGISRRVSSLTEPARFRRGSRSRPEGLGTSDDSVPQAETVTSPPDTTPTAGSADNGFWADLFPGSDRPKDGA